MMQKMTKQELKILKLLCYSNKEIAERLSVSISTVKDHVHNILTKLEEPTRLRAVIKALKMGLINIYDLKPDIKDTGFWDKNGEYIPNWEEIDEQVE